MVWCPSGQFCSGLSDSQLAKVDVHDPTKQKFFKFESADKLLFPAVDGVFMGASEGYSSSSTLPLTLTL